MTYSELDDAVNKTLRYDDKIMFVKSVLLGHFKLLETELRKAKYNLAFDI